MVTDRLRKDDNPVCFRWLGTAGFELRFGPTHILVDPFVSRSPDARPILNLHVSDLTADAIFLTHGHLDHAADAPAIAQHTGAPVYASAPVCAMLHDMDVPARQLHPLAAGRAIEVEQVRVAAFLSRHVQFDLPLMRRAASRIWRKAFALLREYGAYLRGDVLGYQFAVQGRCVVHLGSAGFYPEELARLHPDVALLPLQGHSNIYRITLQMAELLHPKCVIPHHHDDFYPPLSEQIDVQPFFTLLRKRMPDVEVIEPHIGEKMPLF